MSDRNDSYYGKWVSMRRTGGNDVSNTQCKHIAFTPSSPVYHTYLMKSRVSSGSSVYRHAEKIARHLDATGVYNSTYVENTVDESSYVHVTQWTNCTGGGNRKIDTNWAYEGYLLGVVSYPVLDLSSAISQAKSDAVQHFLIEVRDAKLQGLVFLKELRETVGLLTHPFREMRDLCFAHLDRFSKACKKNGRWVKYSRDRSHVLRSLNESYLEWTYGARPLVLDVKSIAEALAEANLDRHYKKCRGYGRYSIGSASTSARQQFDQFYWQYADKSTGEAVAVARGEVSLLRQLQCGQIPILNLFGLEIPNASAEGTPMLGALPNGFALDVWNMLPWSFVFDYFSNISALLASESISTSSLSWSNFSQVQRYRTERSGKVLGPFVSGNTVTGHLGGWTSQKTTFTRSSGVPSLNVWDFDLRLPGFHQSFNVGSLIAAQSTIRRRLGFTI